VRPDQFICIWSDRRIKAFFNERIHGENDIGLFWYNGKSPFLAGKRTGRIEKNTSSSVK